MDAADAFCLDLARSHYENFPVVSRLAPRELRLDLARIYAFARGADDLADEAADPAEALRGLDEWEAELEAMYEGRPSHPVFVALGRTVERHAIPAEPFRRLIAAFRRDQIQTRYETFDDLLSYCRDSANPVGRLVLGVLGLADEERGRLADATCTALQLVNFWADVPIDRRKGRVYLPLEDLAAFGLAEADLDRPDLAADPRWRSLMAFEVARTRRLFGEGLGLLGLLPPRVRVVVGLFSAGGLRVLGRIEAVGYDVFAGRPVLGGADGARAAARAAAWAVRPPRPPAGPPTLAPGLEAAHAVCLDVFRSRAGNFWPALRRLDEDRRRAIAAVYAFARAADDIVDGDAPREAKWRSITDLRGALDSAWADPAAAADPVLAAVLDAARRFDLPRRPLDDLLAGCASDIERDRYATYHDLLVYCRQVAGTVGILTARILGARDDARAEEMGVAFQLTNILRDVAEDAARGRVYLPLEDLAAFGLRAEDVTARRRPQALRALLAFEADRARRLYARAAPIVEAVAPEARPAMRALVGIYRDLLERVAAAGTAALDRRIEVPRTRKARILLRSLWAS